MLSYFKRIYFNIRQQIVKKPIKFITKPWGHEEIWAKTDDYVGKILCVKAGERLSLQHHEKKEETLLVIEGTILFSYGNDITKLKYIYMSKGDVFHIEPKVIHRITAVTDSVVVEVSTTQLNDVVRHDDDYERA